MFKDRKDAGKKLAEALQKYRGSEALVLGIARGGVEVAAEVADALAAQLDLLVTRKLPIPYNPEAGFGAIAEDGSVFLNQWAKKAVSEADLERIKAEQLREIKRRLEVLRGSKSPPPIKDRTVIIVDDGIAMGSTVRASVIFCKNQGARKIVVASPVSSPEAEREIAELVDDIVILETPDNFMAVAQVYAKWYDMSFEEVNEIMENRRKKH